MATSGRGKGGQGRSAPKPSAATIAKEQADCLKLKLDGKSVRGIGEALGLPSSTVQDRLTAAMAELVLPLADEVRLVELARLDRWQDRIEQSMDAGEDPVRAVPVAVRVQESRRKLLGLDAPERVEQTTTLATADPAVEQLLRRGREELT